MSLTSPQEAASSDQTYVDVRVVDADNHPAPDPEVLFGYLPEPYRSSYWKRSRAAIAPVYDAPDYEHVSAMRADAFPEDGGFAGSDPDMAFQQVIMEAGCDIAILEPLTGRQNLAEINQSMSIALNQWQVNHWLDSKTNWHARWRGSICVSIDDPVGAAREIEYWAGQRYMVQVMIEAEPRPAWGDPRYDPVWEAATRHDLPVTCHLGRGSYELLPMPPVGFAELQPRLHGRVFAPRRKSGHEPDLRWRLRAVSNASDRASRACLQLDLAAIWRMDAIYEARRHDLPEVRRKPSEYVYDHLWFTTQPLDFPDDRRELGLVMEWMES